jgi:hypothetical protein
MEKPIQNASELHMKIESLRALRSAQAAALSKRFDSPYTVFQTIRSLFANKAVKELPECRSMFKDPAVTFARFLLPRFLKKTIFRRSGFITKFFVTIVSKTVARLFTLSRVGRWIFMIESMIRKRKPESPGDN